VLEEVRRTQPEHYEEAREALEGNQSLDERWELMYLTGLLPEQEYHEPFAAAHRRGEAVEFVDLAVEDAQSIYQYGAS
jgi:hypothetical protein